MPTKTELAWIIRSETMNGSESMGVAYLDPLTAKLECNVKNNQADEFTSYDLEQVNVRILNKTEGAVDDRIVALNRESPTSVLRRTGLAKLNQDEKKALGLL